MAPPFIAGIEPIAGIVQRSSTSAPSTGAPAASDTWIRSSFAPTRGTSGSDAALMRRGPVAIAPLAGAPGFGARSARNATPASRAAAAQTAARRSAERELGVMVGLLT